MALNNAVTAKLLTANPAKETHVPVQRKKVNPFSYEEASRLLKAVEGHRLEALFILAITSGSRQAEMLGLTWADIDLNNGMLKITRTLGYGGSKREGGFKWVIGTPKSDRSNRVLWLPDETKTALLAHRKRQAIEKETATQWGCGKGVPPINLRMVHPIPYTPRLNGRTVRRIPSPMNWCSLRRKVAPYITPS